MVIKEIDEHPLLDDAIGRLRYSGTEKWEFREASEIVFKFLVFEITKSLKIRETAIKTPVGHIKSKTIDISCRTVLIPILRSGAAMLPAFQKWIPNCDVGFIGQERNEETAKPREYYSNIPLIYPEDSVLILDPMIATGGSVIATISALLEKGVEEKQIQIVAVIGAPEGLELLGKTFPEISVTVATIDEKLNDQKFIVPGLGDFGDRYYGTEY